MKSVPFSDILDWNKQFLERENISEPSTKLQFSETDKDIILQLTDISITLTGYYYCVEIDAIHDLINSALKNDQASQIYLLVEGEIIPFIIINVMLKFI